MEKKVITFDFDQTLCLVSKLEQEHNGIPNPKHIPFEMVLDEFHKLQSQGHSVNVLTTRMDKTMPDVHDFLEEFDLKPDNVWNTNFSWKALFLNDLRFNKGITVHHHFDDNPEEFCNLLRFPVVAEDCDFSLVVSMPGEEPRFIDMHRNRIDNIDIRRLSR